MSFRERVEHLIEAGFQVLYIPTVERSRCEEELSVIAKNTKMDFITWDAVNGFSTDPTCKDPIEVLLSMDDDNKDSAKWKGKEGIMFIMRNLNLFLSDTVLKQQFQNLYYGRKFSNEYYKRPIIILSPELQIQSDVAPCITLVEFSLPSEKELTQVFTDVTTQIEFNSATPGTVTTYNEDLKADAVQAMRGLTTIEAEDTLAFSLRVNRGFAASLIDTIEDQKAIALKKSEVLTYIPKDRIATMDEIGGYDILKDFINTRKLAYTRKAREVGLELPRGIVLLGIPGTGKSIVGKVVARELGLPLVLLNVSAVFGSLVGESERRIKGALDTIDALDGSVVLIDEAEKGLGGTDQSVGDSGVARRVFGSILTWLTEKRSRTFVVITANKTKGLPPEFLRRGRFDSVFYTDLPDPIERDEILRIHCKKRSIDTKQLDGPNWTVLIEKTDRFVGSELEQVVCDARFMSFAARGTGQPTVEELLEAVASTVPIAEAEKENIEEIRSMCEGRATPVSKRRKSVATTMSSKARGIKI